MTHGTQTCIGTLTTHIITVLVSIWAMVHTVSTIQDITTTIHGDTDTTGDHITTAHGTGTTDTDIGQDTTMDTGPDTTMHTIAITTIKTFTTATTEVTITMALVTDTQEQLHQVHKVEEPGI